MLESRNMDLLKNLFFHATFFVKKFWWTAQFLEIFKNI